MSMRALVTSCVPQLGSHFAQTSDRRHGRWAANDDIPLSASSATHQLQSHLPTERGNTLNKCLMMGAGIMKLHANEEHIKHACN